MKLLIVSHTPHYRMGDGIVGWGATVREIDQLATVFESIVHVAPLYDEPPPGSSMPYESSRVRLRAVKPAGGEGIRAKLGIPMKYPSYAGAILDEMRKADVVHVRAPANISLLALGVMMLARSPAKRWSKYAGDWSGGENEPFSYRLQRWILRRRLQGGVVTVNGTWKDQPAWVFSFVNPCLTQQEIEEGRAATRAKRLDGVVRLLFVGRLETEKGVGVCLEIARDLKRQGVAFELDLIGDGAERAKFESHAREWGVEPWVTFHGGLPRNRLGLFFSKAHFLLLPSRCSEGWPKVLSEAMAYGAVPLSTRISSIPQFLSEFKTGKAMDAAESGPFCGAIQEYLRNPTNWTMESGRACEAASRFSYQSYLTRVKEVLEL